MNHQELFSQYIVELREARSFALAWFDELLAREAEKAGSKKAAEDAVRQRWPCGPSSHPRVIAVVRKYFIACERLNSAIEAREDEGAESAKESTEEDWGTDDEDSDDEETESDDESHDDFWDEEGSIDPPIFLGDLLCGRDDELAEFVAQLVFSPIGEEDGHSV